MIGSPKDDRENCPRKCFRTQGKETRVKFNPGLSANRPSNNWDLDSTMNIFRIPCPWDLDSQDSTFQLRAGIPDSLS